MMDAQLFMAIFRDKHFFDLKRLRHKYGAGAVDEAIELLKATVYRRLAIKDFQGQPLVFCPSFINIQDDTYKALLSGDNGEPYSIARMEEEIDSTLAIENIYSSRSSIQNILRGAAPKNSEEDRIYGIKRGLDFIADKSNQITTENLHRLYMMAIGDYLDENEKLLPGNYYRHDSVYVVGSTVFHRGLEHGLLKQYMDEFISFINTKDDLGVIVKSAVIHFYFSYLHPYFDGNGRMARMVQLWYLIQNDYHAALLVSFSQLIKNSKSQYYKAFELVEGNAEVSKIIDVTPFLNYFNKNVFSKLIGQKNNRNLLELFQRHVTDGRITVKEKELFIFVLSNYDRAEFSTKQLEKDYKNVAYATIRSFVLKFTELGLLSAQKYGNKTKYRIKEY